MYPPLPPSGDFEVMLGESLSHHIETNLNFENNKPSTLTSPRAGTNLNKTRQALFKKGGRRVRSTTSSLQSKRHHSQQQHQKHSGLLRNTPMRLADINNNNTVTARSKSPVQSNAELSTNRAQATIHLKSGTKKELLKSKTGRVERATLPSGQSVHTLSKHEQTAQNLNARSKHSNGPGNAAAAKKYDNSCCQKPSSPLQFNSKEVKKPLDFADNVKIVNVCQAEPIPEDNLKDGEKIYAGAKFSEPPSPSVLPKPPSHWVGENAPQHSDHSREQMSVHLKTLLKVQAKP